MAESVEPHHKEQITRDNWRQFAACRGTDPELFFPVGTSGPAIEQIEQAKAICRTCMAQTVCLEYALETKQDDGIWGGVTEEERRVMRKNRIARPRSA